MCVNPTLSYSSPQSQSGRNCPAKAMGPLQRQELALQALSGSLSVSQLAQENEVSRKFVGQQQGKAQEALDQAFAADDPDADAVLFYVPVTKTWLKQLILGLVLICHSPLRGVWELLRDLFDYPISLGQIFNIVCHAVPQARTYNAQQDLAQIRIGAHDEIFQNGQPILVGADVASTYCYLLSPEEKRDADTWGVRLLELQDRGFQPEATIADAASGLRAGQALALPEIPCRGDVFHALQTIVPVVSYLENRAYEAIATRSKLERQQGRTQKKTGWRDQKLSQKLRYARPVEATAIALAEDVTLLLRWLQHDILSVAGPAASERRALFDFVVAELHARASLCPHRLNPVCQLLENQRDDLLAFAVQLDQDIAAVAEEFQVSPILVRDLLENQSLPGHDFRRWQREAVQRQQLHGRFFPLSEAVETLAGKTVRASSIIENLNGRLRSYFFLRRHLGPDYLALLQFFLNHRRFLRSEHSERVGKSPAELLTGQTHPHWLEMLGFTRFSRS